LFCGHHPSRGDSFCPSLERDLGRGEGEGNNS